MIFKSLLSVVTGGASEIRVAAIRALRHMASALLANPDPLPLLVGERAGPWAEFVNLLSRNRLPMSYGRIRALMFEFYNAPRTAHRKKLQDLGSAARRLLVMCDKTDPPDLPLITAALRGVCRTYLSDPELSVELIRESLAPARMAEFGFEEIPQLADEVGHLIPLAPGLVEEIYQAAFLHAEGSHAPTYMGDDIFSLSSNRQQEYDIGLYTLKEAYPRFFSLAPREALRVIDVAVDERFRHKAVLVAPQLAQPPQFNSVARKLRFVPTGALGGMTEKLTTIVIPTVFLPPFKSGLRC